MIKIAVFIFIFGSFIGSFLNVCISRIPQGESIAHPPSHCSFCGKDLKPLDLIPLISYIFLKGRCRYCSTELSLEYPLMEIFTGVLFSLIYIAFGASFALIKYMVFASLAIVIGFIDFKHQDVYSSTILIGGCSAIIFMILEGVVSNGWKFNMAIVSNYLLGAFIGAICIAFIVYTTKGMGEGDIQIAALCGAFLGWKLAILTLFLSFFIGGTAAGILLLRKKKKGKDSMAYGSFLCIGAFVALFIGNALIKYYLLFF